MKRKSQVRAALITGLAVSQVISAPAMAQSRAGGTCALIFDSGRGGSIRANDPIANVRSIPPSNGAPAAAESESESGFLGVVSRSLRGLFGRSGSATATEQARPGVSRRAQAVRSIVQQTILKPDSALISIERRLRDTDQSLFSGLRVVEEVRTGSFSSIRNTLPPETAAAFMQSVRSRIEGLSQTQVEIERISLTRFKEVRRKLETSLLNSASAQSEIDSADPEAAQKAALELESAVRHSVQTAILEAMDVRFNRDTKVKWLTESMETTTSQFINSIPEEARNAVRDWSRKLAGYDGDVARRVRTGLSNTNHEFERVVEGLSADYAAFASQIRQLSNPSEPQDSRVIASGFTRELKQLMADGKISPARRRTAEEMADVRRIEGEEVARREREEAEARRAAEERAARQAEERRLQEEARRKAEQERRDAMERHAKEIREFVSKSIREKQDSIFFRALSDQATEKVLRKALQGKKSVLFAVGNSESQLDASQARALTDAVKKAVADGKTVLYDADSTSAAVIRAAADGKAIGVSGRFSGIEDGVIGIDNGYRRLETLLTQVSDIVLTPDSVMGLGLLVEGQGGKPQRLHVVDPSGRWRPGLSEWNENTFGGSGLFSSRRSESRGSLEWRDGFSPARSQDPTILPERGRQAVLESPSGTRASESVTENESGGLFGAFRRARTAPAAETERDVPSLRREPIGRQGGETERNETQQGSRDARESGTENASASRRGFGRDATRSDSESQRAASLGIQYGAAPPSYTSFDAAVSALSGIRFTFSQPNQAEISLPDLESAINGQSSEELIEQNRWAHGFTEAMRRSRNDASRNTQIPGGAVAYGSAGGHEMYDTLVYRVAYRLGLRGVPLTQGGSGGYMKLVGEAASDAGAYSIGVPKSGGMPLPNERHVARDVQTITIDTDSYQMRIPVLGTGREIVILNPGGMGTMKEFAYTLMEMAAGKLDADLVLVSQVYYGELGRWLKELPIPERLRSRIHIINSEAEADRLVDQIIARSPEREANLRTDHHFTRRQPRYSEATGRQEERSRGPIDSQPAFRFQTPGSEGDANRSQPWRDRAQPAEETGWRALREGGLSQPQRGTPATPDQRALQQQQRWQPLQPAQRPEPQQGQAPRVLQGSPQVPVAQQPQVQQPQRPAEPPTRTTQQDQFVRGANSQPANSQQRQGPARDVSPYSLYGFERPAPRSRQAPAEDEGGVLGWARRFFGGQE